MKLGTSSLRSDQSVPGLVRQSNFQRTVSNNRTSSHRNPTVDYLVIDTYSSLVGAFRSLGPCREEIDHAQFLYVVAFYTVDLFRHIPNVRGVQGIGTSR